MNRAGQAGAGFAIDFFILKVAQFTAMMAVSFGGLDASVFFAGIGENAAQVRDGVVERLAMLTRSKHSSSRPARRR